MDSRDRLDLVDAVVVDLVAGGTDPDRIMVIGAEARDRLHHVVFGRSDPVRSTSDVDIAIATDDWDTYERLVSRYQPTGANGVRFIVADLAVDFMPFGTVEDPDGIVTPSRRREAMSVFGLADVHASASMVDLPSGLRVRFPGAAGYVVLKLRAWVDRGRFNDRDSQDLALAVDRYCGDPVVRDASWGADRIDLMEEYESDTDLVAARVLGREAASVVSMDRARELGQLLHETPLDPRSFEVSRTRRTALGGRTARARALTAGFNDVARAGSRD